MSHLPKFVSIALLLAFCLPAEAQQDKRGLKILVRWMTGDFSSEAQSKLDSDFYDIRLHIRPIWSADKGNHWLYVEQSVAGHEDKPYRQRIYKVESDGKGGFVSVVYSLPEAEKWVGGYKNPLVFEELKPESLSLRSGCAVHLRKISRSAFEGSTEGTSCESALRGAKYATSRVTITSRMLLSWDQGFNESGEQVWGARKGGYQFVKQ